MSADGSEHIPRGIGVASFARWVLVAATAAIAVASVLYARGTFEHRSGGAAAAHGAGGAKKVLYQCPMHPQIIRDQPGECPICGMTLVATTAAAPDQPPGPAASSSAPRAGAVPGLVPVELSAERIQLAGIKTAKVVKQPLASRLSVAGVVATSERGLAEVNIRFAGWIQDLFVPETGRRVKRGEPLATIYSPDVLSAQQEFLTARRWSAAPGHDGAPATGHAGTGAAAGEPAHTHESLTAGMADDARQRLDLLGVSAQEIDEIARTGQARRAITIRAPVSGTVIRRGAVAGGYVQPGTELFAIADLSTVWILAEVYERDMARVRVGQPARVELAGFAGDDGPRDAPAIGGPGAGARGAGPPASDVTTAMIKGRVQFLYPAVDPETRTMRIRVEVRNAGNKLRPGMYATVHLDLPGAQSLNVPSDAVVDTGQMQYLFVAKGGGRFEPRRVKVGAQSDGVTEIREGVDEGETVVTSANFLVDSESRLRAAIEGTR